jgi:hypothetical protein
MNQICVGLLVNFYFRPLEEQMAAGDRMTGPQDPSG